MQQMEQNRLDTADASIIPSVNAVLLTLNAELKSTRQAIHAHIDNDPDLKQRRDLLDSIPGIGPATIAYLLVALSPHRGFTNAKQVVAHTGLAPAIRQSGQWVGKTHIAKNGDPRLRKALYMPALVAWQYNPASVPIANALRPTAKTASSSPVPPCVS